MNTEVYSNSFVQVVWCSKTAKCPLLFCVRFIDVWYMIYYVGRIMHREWTAIVRRRRTCTQRLSTKAEKDTKTRQNLAELSQLCL